MNDRVDLFRREAVLEREQRFVGKIVLARPLSSWMLTLLAAGSAALVLCFALCAGVTRREQVTGQLALDQRTARIYSPSSGVILRRLVQEGQQVVVGQALFVVSTDRRSAAGGDTEQAVVQQLQLRKVDRSRELVQEKQVLATQYQSLKRKLADLRAQCGALDAQIGIQNARTEINTRNLARIRQLADEGYFPLNQLQDREQDNLNQQAQLQSMRSQRLGLQGQVEDLQNQVANFPLTMANQLSATERDIAQIDQDVAESEGRREIVVNAKVNGAATAPLVDAGQYVDSSTLLLSVVPQNAKLVAELEVPSSAVGFVHVGTDVLIRYDAFPYQKFGQFSAHVTHVSRTALQPSELKMLDAGKETYYRVSAELDDASVEVYGNRVALQDGMKLDAVLLLERRKIYEWVLEPLYAIKGRLSR